MDRQLVALWRSDNAGRRIRFNQRHWNFECLRINRIHPCRRMAVSASQVRMHAALMAISTGRDSPLPRRQHDAIADPHCLGHSGIKVTVSFYSQVGKLVTNLAIRRNRRDSRFSVVTCETACVTDWPGLERALLQPECITQILRRLGYVLFARFALGLIGLMTNPTV